MTAGTADQPEADTLSRRKMLTVGSVGLLGVAGLAACGGGDTSTDTPAASDTGAAPSAAAGDSGSSAATSLTKLSKVPVGGSVAVTVDGKPVIVAQPSAGKAVAFSAVCTHQGCTVAAGTTLKCPCHGSTFDPATGKNLSGPAPSPLPAVSVEVVDGDVVLKA
jgi:cytochrome b6-f complex iron-sulfur subunit